MKLIDISWPITNDTTTYKNNNPVRIYPIKTYEENGVRETKYSLSTHTATHIDLPGHFLPNISLKTLEPFVTPCVVVEIKSPVITLSLVQHLSVKKGDVILFKTKNSALSATGDFFPSFVYLDAEAAEYVATQQIKAVGIDYLGIERNQKEHETHKHLLKRGVLIIEGLRLVSVEPGNYMLHCFPLALHAPDAIPARCALSIVNDI